MDCGERVSSIGLWATQFHFKGLEQKVATVLSALQQCLHSNDRSAPLLCSYGILSSRIKHDRR